eukprot:TRINITY_DN1029_c0_g3_i3.p2 TRINITY_DN1029_c0_g3~~TRINITY_DN1029_c0_g3_i3.p2  ORF type:complete len:232 (+),score=40.18 TRINITY_DN1029_c0_g3_i3:410-1105(+)
MAERKNCMMCTGMGHFDTWSKPCPESSMHKEMDCPLCKGNCYVFGDWKKCETCSGMGGMNTWSKGCLKIDMHWRKTCHMCDGVGYTPVAAYPQVPPSLPTAPPMPVPMPMPMPHHDQPYVPPPCQAYPVPGPVPVPMPMPIPQAPPGSGHPFEGQWRNAADLHDVSTMVPLGPSKFMMTNPTQSWSPSFCNVTAPSVVTFNEGGLSSLTATINPENNVLTFSNSCQMVRLT